MSRRGEKVVDPTDEPLVVTPMTTAGPQPWHPQAHELRAAGWTIRAIARHLGKGFGSVQRLMNPESKARQKARDNEYDIERRATDPAYAKKGRDYRRRYMQLRAPERWKDDCEASA